MLAFSENCGIIVNALRCGCSSVVEHQPSKLDMWVRFPSPALCASGSVGGARPCQGRGRGFESRLALSKKHKKMVSNRIPSFLCFRAPPGLEGSRSPLRSGRCETNVHRTFRNVSRSDKQEGTCGYYFCISNPAGLEGSRTPLRSLQSERPPDVLQRLAL